MRKIFTILAISTLLVNSALTQVTTDEYTITCIEEVAKFNSAGLSEFLLWVYKNISYPETAIKESISGRVIAKIMIDTSGILSISEIMQSVRSDLDTAVIKTLNPSPVKTPAIQMGKHINIYYTIPIYFDYKDPYFEKMIKIYSTESKKGRNERKKRLHAILMSRPSYQINQEFLLTWFSIKNIRALCTVHDPNH